MIEPFLASNIKIDRAKSHLNELATVIGEYFARGCARIVLEPDPEMEVSGIEICCFKYRESEPIPLKWSAIIGDAVHNMRTSLDLLACDIHRISGGKAKDRHRVHFPFCKDKADLPEVIKSRCLSGIGKEFINAIHTIAPYKGGNEGLLALHDLDVLDKHQALVPTVSVAKMPWPGGLTPKDGPPEFGTSLSCDGQRIIAMPRIFCPLPYGSELKAEFLIVFDKGPFVGAPVLDQLRACFDSIEAIVGLFQDLAKKTGALR